MPESSVSIVILVLGVVDLPYLLLACLAVLVVVVSFLRKSLGRFAGTKTWRSDPNLKDRFSPEFPDDLQVLFYDYESLPRDPAREMMWVHLTGCVTAGVYEGTLLNQPSQLKCVHQDDKVMIRLALGVTYPFYLSAQAARDRQDWGMRCQTCGFDMLPCPPAALIEAQFQGRPDPSRIRWCTTRCWACGKTMWVWQWDMDDEERGSQLPSKPSDVLRSPLYQDQPGRE